MDLQDIFKQCHDAAVAGGWWHDIKTGERLDRNKGELLALIHSEVSEAYDAWIKGSLDDKLPHHPGVVVELADVIIRIADYAGGFNIPVHEVVASGLKEPQPTPRMEEFWPELHGHISMALEGARRGSSATELLHLSECVIEIVALCDSQLFEFDIWGVVREKLAYNAARADHKPENRAKEGGKKF